MEILIFILLYIANIIFCNRVGNWLDKNDLYSDDTNEGCYTAIAVIPIINIIAFLCCIGELIIYRDKIDIDIPNFSFLSKEAKNKIKEAKLERKNRIAGIDKELNKEIEKIKRIDRKEEILKTLELTDEDLEYLRNKRGKL